MTEQEIKRLRKLSLPVPIGNFLYIELTKEFVDLFDKIMTETEQKLNSEKESEEKTMHHNVTITKEESRVIEEYWCIRAVKENYVTNAKSVIGEMKCDKEPTLNEIATFLDNMQADFVSVEHNYRFADLPFC